ncbi:MAG: ssl1498 family light-harvesting-like protein [Jaaginema sp. PMC 1079.18]|nr:ssl1498 family light-harvesting-like protein [Jaaginema sp. PMC 1080.18]MEC4850765.1 ssl1498 family light-harvesting-like protein [Jaaginema sp. PMC 1079.18]MEC4866992.1 ssl1498 family light-harvesting-like protein [Jaaginema sp. PMC 1078.18]
MPYTNEEGGRLNNFASEPKVYKAEPPNSTEKRNYLIMGIGALALVSGLMYIAVTVS